MAKKFLFRNTPAYQEGPFAIVKEGENGLWRLYHIQSNLPAMWIVAPFKQKRDALNLALSMASSDIDWNVDGAQMLVDLNGLDHVHTVMSNLTRGLN